MSRAPVAVRPATGADVDRMVALYSAVTDEGPWMGAEGPVDIDDLRRRWSRRIADAEGVYLVAEAADGTLVGQASLDLASYGVAYLAMLVERVWRRRGVGTALVESALVAARDHGCHKVSLQVWPHNEPARALYRRFGFEEEGVLRGHYPRRDGELWDALVLGLLL